MKQITYALGSHVEYELRVGDTSTYRPSDPNALIHPRPGVPQNRVALLGTAHCQSARLKQGSDIIPYENVIYIFFRRVRSWQVRNFKGD